MKKIFAGLPLFGLIAVFLGSALSVAQAPRMTRVQAFAPQRPPVEQALGAQVNAGRWWNNQRMIEQLKLTDDQRKAMDLILYDHRAKLIDLQANLKKAELAMQPLMAADQPDAKLILAQIDKVVAARGDLERANARFLLDIRLKLTPDQWKLLKEIRADLATPPAPAPAPAPMRQQRMPRNGQGAPPPPGAPGSPNALPPPGGPGAGFDQ